MLARSALLIMFLALVALVLVDQGKKNSVYFIIKMIY
jgi:hypothetical protein